MDFLDGIAEWQEGLRAKKLLSAEADKALTIAIKEAREGRLINPPPPLLTVLLLGASGGGKSELLNALAGERIAASHYLRPTTSTPTIYLHAEVNPARLYEYGAELGDMAARPGAVRIHRRDELRHKVIIDAPDIDSYRTEHRDQVMRLLPLVDVALYVVTPFSYKDDQGWAVVLRERGRRAFAFVMNKWDAEGCPGGQEGVSIEQDFVRLVEERGGYAKPLVFLVSARRWAAPEAERETVPRAGAGENFAGLRDWLEAGLSASRIEQIQRRRRRALWGGLAAAVGAARMPKVDAAAVRKAAMPELDALAAEGAALWQGATERRVETMARRREEEGRPHSPGPFGRLSAGVSAAINLGQSWRKVSDPDPDVTFEEMDALAERSGELASRRLDGVEWKLREMEVPTGGLNRAYSALAAELPGRLKGAFERASAQALEKVAPRWKLSAGWAVVIVFELLTVALLGLAAWRLVQAFIAGQYLDLKFTLNLLALLGILLAAGSAFMAILYPPVKARVRRALRGAMEKEWLGAGDRATVELDGHLEKLERLNRDGEAIGKALDERIGEITREISAVPDDETGRLFQG